MPRVLANGLYEAFARKHIALDDGDPTPEIKRLMKTEYDLDVPVNWISYGAGVAPLFASLLTYIRMEGEEIFLSGAYGEFVAASLFFGVPVRYCQTAASNDFKISPESLHKALARNSKATWIFLNGPIVNPTGAGYSTSELREIFNLAKAHGARIIFDSTFAGLQFDGGAERCSLENVLNGAIPWVFFGGVSKLLAAGGLRFGYTFSNRSRLNEHFKNALFERPHVTIKYAVKKVYRQMLESSPELVAALSQQRSVLAKRAKTLSELLVSFAGGLYCLQKVDYLLWRSLMLI